MAGASDKARFYLEQSVPELQEFSRKKIFSKDEISSISKRRSDFEYKLNARGSMALDYARYAQYEMNLESLRRKRVKRLGVKTSHHTGQRRIFFVLDRATRKFPGDIALWMQYLTFARKQGSSKKSAQILTAALRLHPTKAEMWVYAASYAMYERGDMTEARGYMQRGLRFCQRSEKMWLEYYKLELIWISKMYSRRRVLGIGEDQQEGHGGEIEGGEDDMNGDGVAIPTITLEDMNPRQKKDDDMDQGQLEKFQASPALSGAIPIALFDAAMKEFRDNEELCMKFYDTTSGFQEFPVAMKISDHIMRLLQVSESPEALIRFVRRPVTGLQAISRGFPTQFGLCLERIKTSFARLEALDSSHETSSNRGNLADHVINWILQYLEEDGLDPDVARVMVMTLRKAWSHFQASAARHPSGRAPDALRLIENMQRHGLHNLAEPAIAWVKDVWPNDDQFILNVAQNVNQ